MGKELDEPKWNKRITATTIINTNITITMISNNPLFITK